MLEIWKQILKFPIYEVSNFGNFRNIETKRLTTPYLFKNNGFNSLGIKLKDNNGKRNTVMAARIVAYYFVENPKKYTQFIYKDNNKLNIIAENLEWVKIRKIKSEGRKGKRKLSKENLEKLIKGHIRAATINIPLFTRLRLIKNSELSDNYKNLLIDFTLNRNKGTERFYEFFMNIIRKDFKYLNACLYKIKNRTEVKEDLYMDCFILLCDRLNRGCGIKEIMNDAYLRVLIIKTIIFKYKSYYRDNKINLILTP